MTGKIYAIMIDDNMVATDYETKEELVFGTEEEALEYIYEQDEEYQDYSNAVYIREIDIEGCAKALYDIGWRAANKGDLIEEHGHKIGIMLAEALEEIECH